jgi:putative hydrolase of the HAD superfamily
MHSGHPVAPVRALLFDLGGVLIDIDFDRAFALWASISALSREEIKRRFRFDEPYQLHERGVLSAAEYFAHLRTSLLLRGDTEQIAKGWNSIFVSEIMETRRVVEVARKVLPCYAFTNSNPTHQAFWTSKFPLVVACFDHVFVSSEIGLRKPDCEAFRHISETLAAPAGSIMFFDDLLENVNGASAAGLQSVHVRGPGDVLAAVQAIGIAL